MSDRVIEALDATVDGAAASVVAVLIFSDAELKRTVGANGGYRPDGGVLSISGAGTIDKVKKMICRRTEDPDQGAYKVFDLTNGLSLADFNALFAFGNLKAPVLPKYPVLGGYEIEMTLKTSGGSGAETVAFVTKGENFHEANPGPRVKPNTPSQAAVGSLGSLVFPPTNTGFFASGGNPQIPNQIEHR